MRNLFAIALALGAAAASAAPGLAQNRPSVDLSKIVVAEGFEFTLFAENVPGARQMALSPGGVLYVGSMREGRVYAVVDGDKDFKADRVHVIAEGLSLPNGVAFRDGSLYVAEVSRILRFDGVEDRLEDPPPPVTVTDVYPTDRHHGWKHIAFGPDGKLYVPVGAPCNICERLDDPRYASITRINPDGSGLEVYASGVRNTVGFTWHPVTGDLWFTDNGGDNLGDNLPPDELNRAGEKGLHFGYPYCHGGFLSDPTFGSKRGCGEFTAPARNLGPHVAALGAEFYTGEMFPDLYRHQLFIAEHGSWNRSIPLGYRVTLARIQNNRDVVNYEIFAEGWLQDGEPWGRPVDVLQYPDGSLLVSDDLAGVIYRVSYRERP